MGLPSTFTFPAKYNNKYVYFLFSSDATGTTETTDFIQIVNNTVSLTYNDVYNAIYGCIVDDVNVVTKSDKNILVNDNAINALHNGNIYRIDNVYGVTNITENYITHIYKPFISLTPIGYPPNAYQYTIQVSGYYINSYDIVLNKPSDARTDVYFAVDGMGETTINAFMQQNPLTLNITCYDHAGNAIAYVPRATYTSDTYEIEFIPLSKQITYTLSHCTGASSNPTEIGDTEVTATFTADALYALPETIIVTGANYTWEQSTGKLTLSNPTGDVSVTITAEIEPQNSVKLSSLAGWAAIPDGKHIIQIIAMGDEDLDSMPSAGVEITKTTVYTITATLSNVTADSTNPNNIVAGGYATLIFTAADGYKLPDTITVTGANYTWEQSTGVLDIYEPSANVAITITGTASQS